MLRITVTQFNGQPAEQPLAADFDELGGKIGRGNDNTLVLPDVQRFISRTHALVIFRAGRYLIRDVGSASPVFVNDLQLDNGQEAPLRDGDEIRIAGYSMRVADEEARPTPRVAEGGARSEGRSTEERPATPLPAATKDDPLAAFGGGNSADDPFAGLIPSPQSPAMKPAPLPAARRMDERRQEPARGASPPAAGGTVFPRSAIPDDFDPFAEPAPAQPEGTARLPDDIDLGPGSPGRGQKIDELFDLGPADASDPFRSVDAPAEPLDLGTDSASLDPMVAMGLTPPARPSVLPPQRDDAPEIYGAYRLPKATEEPAAPRTHYQPLPTIEPVRRNVEPPPTREAAPREPDPLPRIETPIPDAGSATPPRALTPADEQAIRDELLRAFLAGAGVDDVHIPGGMTPQLMNMLGQLLRANTQGTLDLLLARAATKRQLRAEMTIIAARENNPLKFSPSVEGALTHLLAPGRGFMTPLRAIKDAYNDLRSHEVGFLAGMRAALAGVLARFAPTQLEKRLTRKTVLDSVLPMNRQAKLWALFEELYADISTEAEDNFHNLFGREFMRAYEAQIAKLEEEERAAKR